jgi:hypothetical protein
MPAKTLALLLAAAALAALPLPASAAGQVTSEQAMENYRLMTVEPPACPDGGDPDDINVCGRRSPRDAYRLPLVEPTPGERVRGEPISTVAAAGTREKCTVVGPNQECGGGLPLLGIAILLAKIVEKKVLNPED